MKSCSFPNQIIFRQLNRELFEWHLTYADFFVSFPSCIIMGNLRAGFPSKDLRLDCNQHINKFTRAHLSVKFPKMLLWKFGPLKWFAFVDKDIGPPTSMGESDLEGVGLVVELFWSLSIEIDDP